MKAVDHIARSPLFQDLAVHFVTVGSATPDVTAGVDDARPILQAAGIEAETALAGRVEEVQIDMLVMGAYGHSRIRSQIIGFTTTAMIRACKVPVLLLQRGSGRSGPTSRNAACRACKPSSPPVTRKVRGTAPWLVHRGTMTWRGGLQVCTWSFKRSACRLRHARRTIGRLRALP